MWKNFGYLDGQVTEVLGKIAQMINIGCIAEPLDERHSIANQLVGSCIACLPNHVNTIQQRLRYPYLEDLQAAEVLEGSPKVCHRIYPMQLHPLGLLGADDD